MSNIFDPAKLRDRGFRDRFHAKLDEVRSVRKTHTFLAYATNKGLIEQLKAIYLENLENYQSCYLDNVEAFEQLKSRINKQEKKLHKARLKELRGKLPQITQQLEAEDYNQNAATKPLIEELAGKVNTWLEEFASWEEDLKGYRFKLKEVMNQIWSEQFEVFKHAYQERKAEVYGDHLPASSIRLEGPVLQAAIEERSKAVDSLMTKARKVPRFLPAAEAFHDSYASYEAFQDLDRDIDRALANRARIRWVGLAAVAALLIAGVYFGPGLYRNYNEDNVWEKSKQENTFQAYNRYMKHYPEGRHVVKARNAQLLLDEGEIPGFTDINGETFDYKGALSQGLPEGMGIAAYPNGDRYEGEWEGGIRSGIGKMEYASDGAYEGQWKFGKPHGKGTHAFGNGDHYKGSWKNGLFHGRGTLSFADGSFYDGQWAAGKQEGKGTFQSAENLKYIGAWKGGKREGEGTQDYADGSTYVGNWRNDQRHGWGKIYFPDRSQYAGAWRNDLIKGKGVFTSKLREEFAGTWEGDPSQITLRDETGRVTRQGKFEGGLFKSY